jgi:hypothetical protein
MPSSSFTISNTILKKTWSHESFPELLVVLPNLTVRIEMSKTTSKSHTFVMYVIAGLQVFYTEYVGIVVFYLLTKLYMSSSNGSLVIAIKAKAKY